MVSIIIPLYNKEKAIKDTLKSVLNQTYLNFEIIVVDDGSKDRSAEIVKEISDNRIKYYYKGNRGVSSARNYGVLKANYSWVLFLDADDLLEIDALETFVSLTIKYPDYLVFTAGFYVLNNGNKIKKTKNYNDYIVKEPLKEFWRKKIFPRTGNTLVNKEALIFSGCFDERVSYNEDYGFNIRLLSNYNVIASGKTVMVYVQDFNNLSSAVIPIESEFAYHSMSISIENKYVKYLLYDNLNFSYKRRILMNDFEGASMYKKILVSKFSLIDKFYFFIEKLLIRIIKLYNF
jgi:glycosyltransferase involved in cell wall biosynthesis